MKDTTLTFTTFSNQAPVEFLDDPTKPSCWDLTDESVEDDREDDEQQEVEKLPD